MSVKNTYSEKLDEYFSECRNCKRDPDEFEPTPIQCEECEGYGHFDCELCIGWGRFDDVECPECHGEGTYKCPECNGTGVTEE